MAFPWLQILRWAPQILGVSGELMKRSRREVDEDETDALVTADDTVVLLRRVVALEENERRQRELVERMAEQQATLSRAVLALHQRERWLIGSIGVLLILVVWALLR